MKNANSATTSPAKLFTAFNEAELNEDQTTQLVSRTDLKGASDVTAELLNEIISDYGVGNLEVRTVV
jgi:hypothetical protein